MIIEFTSWPDMSGGEGGREGGREGLLGREGGREGRFAAEEAQEEDRLAVQLHRRQRRERGGPRGLIGDH